MQIGTTIRALRKEKNMTQAELAGTVITRNMLSRIETGSVQPSLTTLDYLAGRLGVPVGRLLSGDPEAYAYSRARILPLAKQAYRKGAYGECLDRCRELGPHADSDDEICLLRAQCHLEKGKSDLLNCRLLSAASELSDALRCADRTLYQTDWIRRSALRCFREMRSLSGKTYAAYLPDLEQTGDPEGTGDPFLSFLSARNALSRNDPETATEYLSARDSDEDDAYASLVRAELCVYDRDYTAALVMLGDLLKKKSLLPPLLLYYICLAYEICCHETGDYKSEIEAAKIRSDLSPAFKT